MIDKVQSERLQMIFRNVRANAKAQVDAEHRENYFKSCEAHQGDLALVVSEVRKEFSA